MKLAAYENIIKIVIADDHCIFRKGLFTALHNKSKIKVVAQASNGKELVDIIEKCKPDVIVTDIEMPIMNGIEATACISKKFPQISIIAISMHDQEEVISQMIEAGAKGFVLKNCDAEELVQAIQTVHNNQSYYSNQIITKLVKLRSKSNQSSNRDLTEKEIAVMKLICQQFSSKEIADQMDSSVRSIESAKERIQNKIGVRNMVGIALYAVKEMYVLWTDITSLSNQ